MSIIQTTATTYPGARRRPAVTPREVRPAHWQLSGLLICGVLFSALGAILLALGMDANRSAAAQGQVWIPWAVMAGVRVEHAWRGSHVVLGFDDVRTDAPLREARRTLRRMVSAAAMVIASAVALAWVALGVAAYVSLADLTY